MTPEQWLLLLLGMITSPTLAVLLTNVYNRGHSKAATALLKEQIEDSLRSRITSLEVRIDDQAAALQECREARRISEEINTKWLFDNKKLEVRLEQKDLQIKTLEIRLADHIAHSHS